MSEAWASGESYERYIGRWSRLVARVFLDWLAVPPNRQWIDVGCGTGTLSQMILDTTSPDAVKGIDQSEDYLAFARQHHPRASFEVGDAQNLPVDPAAYDAAVSGLVLNFVPEPLHMVAEMARVVRPGGIVALYVWDYAGLMELIRYSGMRLSRSTPRPTRWMKACASPSATRSRWPRCFGKPG